MVCTLTGCQSVTTAWTEGYQKAVYGHALEPLTPCKKGYQFVNLQCRPKPGGPS